MKPLNVTLIHRDRDSYRYLCGWWSYPVPEFTWKALKVAPNGFVARPDLRGVDLLMLDDWIWGKVHKVNVPLAYWTIDSARSDMQLSKNRAQAHQADLMLVDSDRLEKFDGLGIPVKRAAYAVNEQVYHPHAKHFDVAFLCWPTPERRAFYAQLCEICERRGWSLLSGTYNPAGYADALGLAKVVVTLAHVKQARTWRVFDVMATRSALLTNPIPLIDGDGIRPNEHYAEYCDMIDLEYKLEALLSGVWEQIAECGYQHVMARHTWATRAKELREMFYQELGI